jgi:hypothetical protein
VSNETTRKRFLAKVLGLAAVGAAAPTALAKAMTSHQTKKADVQTTAFTLRANPLAVARRDGTA